jgi:hypothetical protein
MSRTVLALLTVAAFASAARAVPGDVTREDLAFAYTAFPRAVDWLLEQRLPE